MNAPTTQAEQEDAVREAWAYLTPHPYSDGPIILDPSKMRKAIATLRTERDQLAADLRKAREALKVAQSALAMLTEPQAIRTTRVHEAWATAVDAELQCRRALTPDPNDAGGTAKGDEHAR